MSKFIKDFRGDLINLEKVDMVYREDKSVKVLWGEDECIIKQYASPKEVDEIMDKITKYLEVLEV